MRSPLSPATTNIFMNQLEKKAIDMSHLTSTYSPDTWIMSLSSGHTAKENLETCIETPQQHKSQHYVKKNGEKQHTAVHGRLDNKKAGHEDSTTQFTEILHTQIHPYDISLSSSAQRNTKIAHLQVPLTDR